MADETLVSTCRVADFNASTGVCSAPFYSAQGTSFPTMTIDDAQSIGLAIAVLWALAFCLRAMRKAVESW